jgi:hypothetical protein
MGRSTITPAGYPAIAVDVLLIVTAVTGRSGHHDGYR